MTTQFAIFLLEIKGNAAFIPSKINFFVHASFCYYCVEL